MTDPENYPLFRYNRVLWDYSTYNLLTNEDKDFNHEINSARAAIENINQRLETYGILGGVYRGDIDDFHKMTKITQVVSALCNMNLNKHPV
ncbi:unnamed protein product, partial [Rotaria sp. Silwood2]